MDFQEFETQSGGKGKIKGSLLKGYAVAIVLTLILEVVVTFTLNPQSNLVHRLITYFLGILVIFFLALFTKSILKMIFLGIPVVTVVSFVPPRVAPSIFTDLFGQFLYLSDVLTAILQVAQTNPQIRDSIGQSTIDLANQYLPFLFVVDIVVALIVMMFAGIGLTLLVRMFSKKPNILIIFSIVFTIIFLLIGVVVLPYAMTVTSGLTQFGSDMAIGSAYMLQGVQEMQDNFNTGNFSLVDDYLSNATIWYKDARSVLRSLDGLGIKSLVNLAAPQYFVIVDQGFTLVDAIVDISNGLAPLVVGFGNLKIGFEKAFSEFGTLGGVGALALLQSNDTFEEGLRYIEIGMKNISDSLDDIKAGVSKLAQLKADEISQAMGGGSADQIKQIQDGAKLFNATLDMFKVLINPIDINGQNSTHAPLIHLLLGTRVLNKVAGKIGNNTDFSGTDTFFANVVSNLTVFRTALNDPAFDAFNNVELNDQTMTEVKSQISSSINFLRDSSDVSIKLGDFGQQIVPILDETNTSLSIFTDPSKNFTTISDAEYNQSYTSLGNVITDAVVLNQTAFELNGLLENMSANAENPGYYGLFTEPAKQFTAMLEKFNVTQNAQNFIYLGHAFRNVILTAQELKKVNAAVDNIKSDFETIDSQPDDASKATELIARAPNIDGNITTADGSLNDSIIYITNAKNNFTLAYVKGGMTQLSNVNKSMNAIIDDIRDIQGPQGLGKIKTIMADPNQYIIDNGISQTLTDLSDSISFMQTKFGSISNNLGNMNLAS